MSDTALDTEASAYAALEKEFGDKPEAAPAEKPEAAAPGAKTEPEKPADEQKQAADKLPYEEIERRYKNLNGALAEERANNRALKERQAQFEQVLQAIKHQRAAERQPQYDEMADPLLSEVEQLKRQNEELAQWQRQIAQEREEAERARTISQAVTYHEQEFARQNADYFDAVSHLIKSRTAELAIMMPDDDPGVIHEARKRGFAHPSIWREDIIRREAMDLGGRALREGQNPAAVFYSLAKHRGYSGQKAAPTPAPEPKPQAQKIEAIRKGQEAPGSLSTGATKAATNAEGFPSLEELAEMYVSDPKGADAMFKKMQKAGLLG